MGWRGALRGYQAAVRREIREERRQLRELIRDEKEARQREAQQLAEQVVARYEATIAMLTSVHHDCGPKIDWSAISTAPPIPPPAQVTNRTRQAEQDRDDYRPGLFARMFGGATKRRASLAAAVEPAREQDRRETEAAHQQHLRQSEEAAAARDLARFVLKGDVSAYAVALEELDVFEELREVGVEIGVNVPSSDVICLQLLAHERWPSPRTGRGSQS